MLISGLKKKKSHGEEVGVSQVLCQEVERGVACDLIPNKTSPGRDFPDWWLNSEGQLFLPWKVFEIEHCLIS